MFCILFFTVICIVFLRYTAVISVINHGTKPKPKATQRSLLGVLCHRQALHGRHYPRPYQQRPLLQPLCRPRLPSQLCRCPRRLQETVELKPDWSKRYYRLGAVYLSLHQAQEAVSAYRKGLEIDPSNEGLKVGLADAQSAAAEVGCVGSVVVCISGCEERKEKMNGGWPKPTLWPPIPASRGGNGGDDSRIQRRLGVDPAEQTAGGVLHHTGPPFDGDGASRCGSWKFFLCSPLSLPRPLPQPPSTLSSIGVTSPPGLHLLDFLCKSRCSISPLLSFDPPPRSSLPTDATVMWWLG
ncbi:hypothetical protein Tsubulata_032071 [Turnera subulata]|uniref:Uncharacterized protein n=1 Tax=Turnera subulata TaxID=218843 RepID=A0A9Q0GB21_9ROSI|nr:hypothetical protein Tsubulata_032071 [Turnera subulata]